MALARHAIQHHDSTGAAFKAIVDSHTTDA
jgi:hypothetical protein